MDTRQAICNRYSCRRFLKKPIEKQELDALLQAAHATPVACKRYGDIRLTVIENPSYLERWNQVSAVYMGNPKSRPLYDAPVLILVSVLVSREIPAENPYLNAGCVVENMALAATDLGIGSVILAAPVRAMRQNEELLTALDLPAGFEPAVALAVGWPGMIGRKRDPACQTLTVQWLE